MVFFEPLGRYFDVNIKFAQLKLFGIGISSQNCVGTVATEFYPQTLFLFSPCYFHAEGKKNRGKRQHAQLKLLTTPASVFQDRGQASWMD